MKRLIPATVILIIIIIMCTVSNRTILNCVKNAKDKINECETLYLSGQFEQAKSSADSFKKYWVKASKKVSFYSNHCPIDDISALAAILPEAAAAKNDFEFKSTLNRIRVALNAVRYEQTFTAESLY